MAEKVKLLQSQHKLLKSLCFLVLAYIEYKLGIPDSYLFLKEASQNMRKLLGLKVD